MLIAGAIALFSKLPKKTRRIVLIAIAVIAVLTLRNGTLSNLISIGTSDEDSTITEITDDTDDTTDTTTVDSGDTVTIENTDAREKRYQAVGNGKDVVTVMIYMCGTDLESNYGMATSDLMEICNATISDNVNIIVETGGCKKWKNSIMSSSTNEIYKVVSGGVEKLETNLGSISMVKPSNLTDFIEYCDKNYPADRNILIFWDHGGGSVSGYGYDEKNGGNDSMTLDEINTALSDAGVTFDWIGFDACLMATYETATVCNNYADYLIASEESEPGTGWYYTDWVTTLSKNTSIDTVSLAKVIVDDFVSTSVSASSSAEVTLSCIDLAELQGIYDDFSEWSASTNTLLSGSSYSTVSNARSGVRQFAADSYLNQIDLVDFADRMATTDSKALATALRSCIKYNKSNISKAYGISIYFPYESMSSMSTATSIMNNIGLDSNYTKCIKSFATLASSGQIASSSSYGYSYSSSGSSIDLSSLLGAMTSSDYSDYGSSYSSSYSDYGVTSLLGSLLSSSSGYSSSSSSISASDIVSLLSSFSGRSIKGADWVDTDLISKSASYISENYIDPADIFTQVKDGKRVLTLTDEQWNIIQTVELNIFLDDGEGYIDLGLDNVFEFDGNDLLLDFDNTWLTINGQVVAYYMTSDIENDDGTWTTTGRIPAILTQEIDGEDVTSYVDIIVVFETGKSGVIVGANPQYTDGNGTTSKGMLEIGEGDEIQFLCDYYTYEGDFDATYTLGDPLTVTSKGLSLKNMDLGDVNVSVTYRLTDIYNNYYWTPAYTMS